MDIRRFSELQEQLTDAAELRRRAESAETDAELVQAADEAGLAATLLDDLRTLAAQIAAAGVFDAVQLPNLPRELQPRARVIGRTAERFKVLAHVLTDRDWKVKTEAAGLLDVDIHYATDRAALLVVGDRGTLGRMEASTRQYEPKFLGLAEDKSFVHEIVDLNELRPGTPSQPLAKPTLPLPPRVRPLNASDLQNLAPVAEDLGHLREWFLTAVQSGVAASVAESARRMREAAPAARRLT